MTKKLAANEGQTVVFDAAIAAITGDYQQRQAQQRLTPAERKEAERQAKRVRVFFDVPEWLRDEIMDKAADERTSASSLAVLLLAVGLREVNAGRVNYERRPSESPRFEWMIETTVKHAGF